MPTTSRSALAFIVAHVVGMRTEEKMIRVDAQSVIPTGAIMANLDPDGYTALVNLVRVAMREHLHTVNGDLPVSPAYRRSDPYPTFADVCDTLKESLGWRLTTGNERRFHGAIGTVVPISAPSPLIVYALLEHAIGQLSPALATRSHRLILADNPTVDGSVQRG